VGWPLDGDRCAALQIVKSFPNQACTPKPYNGVGFASSHRSLFCVPSLDGGIKAIHVLILSRSHFFPQDEWNQEINIQYGLAVIYMTRINVQANNPRGWYTKLHFIPVSFSTQPATPLIPIICGGATTLMNETGRPTAWPITCCMGPAARRPSAPGPHAPARAWRGGPRGRPHPRPGRARAFGTDGGGGGGGARGCVGEWPARFEPGACPCTLRLRGSQIMIGDDSLGHPTSVFWSLLHFVCRIVQSPHQP